MYQAKEMKRNDAFHPDDRLSHNERSELEDYARSGYDRGHVVPSADAYDERTQFETFALSNMMPQNSTNNRGLWAGQESAARMLAKSRGEVYVVSGPLFIGSSIKQLNGRVMVPTHLFKAIYDPTTNQAAAYVDTNDEGQDYKVMSMDELTKFAGIDPFPFLKGSARSNAMDLPKPVAPNFKDHSSTGGESNNHSQQEGHTSEYAKEALEAGKILKHMFSH
jgi:endonuclease G